MWSSTRLNERQIKVPGEGLISWVTQGTFCDACLAPKWYDPQACATSNCKKPLSIYFLMPRL
jgi:hypothetical protein